MVPRSVLAYSLKIQFSSGVSLEGRRLFFNGTSPSEHSRMKPKFHPNLPIEPNPCNIE